jgi:hypothetical protein
MGKVYCAWGAMLAKADPKDIEELDETRLHPSIQLDTTIGGSGGCLFYSRDKYAVEKWLNDFKVYEGPVWHYQR